MSGEGVNRFNWTESPSVEDAALELSRLSEDEDAWTEAFRSLPKSQQAELERMLRDAPRVGPMPDTPQEIAYKTPADVTGYGGAAGGGKSALIGILALNAHQRTVIFRKDAKQMRALIDDLVSFVGSDAGLNRQAGTFYLADRPGHMIEWGGLGDPGSEQVWRGRPHDLMAIDEATEVREDKIRFLMTWMRTVVPGQRCRCVMTFNPPGGPEDPSGGEGRWVIEYFAPWLDELHPNPAKSGEIRHFGVDDANREIELPDATPYRVMVGGREIVVEPQSRTFIAARVEHNKYLAGTKYEQTLASLKEPFRSMMLMGDFRSGAVDHEAQVIPTKWVDEAMARWDRVRREGRVAQMKACGMSALGVDVARGGRDSTTLAARYGWYFDELQVVPGARTPDGPAVVALIAATARDGATVCIDAAGVGAAPFDLAKQGGLNVRAVIGGSKRGLPDMGSTMRCVNVRSGLWWLLRQVLDPSRGFDVMLPKDNRLRKELISPHYARSMDKIRVEPKEEVKRRLGHSTDCADAVIMALYDQREAPGVERVIGAGRKFDRDAWYGDNEAAYGYVPGADSGDSTQWQSL